MKAEEKIIARFSQLLNDAKAKVAKCEIVCESLEKAILQDDAAFCEHCAQVSQQKLDDFFATRKALMALRREFPNQCDENECDALQKSVENFARKLDAVMALCKNSLKKISRALEGERQKSNYSNAFRAMQNQAGQARLCEISV